MSAHLYPVRVYFEPGKLGCVKVPGVYRNLTQAPEIPGLPKMTAIDYAGEAYPPEITPYMDGRRELTGADWKPCGRGFSGCRRGRSDAR